MAEERNQGQPVPNSVDCVRTLGKRIEYKRFEVVEKKPDQRLAREYIQEDHVLGLEVQVTTHSSLGSKVVSPRQV